MSVGMDKREERPAYVRFQRRPIKDAAASEREGKYMAKDVDYALVTPPYSRDVFEQVATEWLAQMEKEVRNNRLPREWYERYEAAYERWKKGEELPLNGTPIKGWAVLSPAQMTNLIAINILTVEDLAAANEEGRRRIGMGAQDLCDKAKAWLSQAKDKGPLTMENSTLKAENQALKTQNKTLEARVKELAERVEIMQRGGLLKEHFYSEPTPARDAIEVSDIIEKVEAQKRPTLTARK
jgi:cell division protein FtsB